MAIKIYLRLLVVYVTGIFWTFFVLLHILRLIIKKRGRFFYKKNRTYPSVLQTEEYGRHEYAFLNEGIKLHYVISGPENAPLMIMLHGFPEFWYSWRHQITEFNKHYRVAAVDLRGYGLSSKPQAVAEYTTDKLVSDIEQLIEILARGKKCILIGHDWGGALTWILAAKNPDLLSKVIVMNCPQPSAMVKYAQRSWKQFMKSWYMFFINMPYLPEFFFSSGDLKMLENTFQGKDMGAKEGAFTAEDIDAFKFAYNSVWDFTGPMNYIRASVRGINKGRGNPKRKVPSTLPLLLVWGTRDGALSKEMAELSKAYAENVTLKYVEGASHWVQQDEPQVVNELLANFLEESTAQG